MYFLAFLYIVTIDLNTLFASFQPPLEGLGEVIFAESPNDPLPPGFQLLLGHVRPASSLLGVGNKKKWAGGEVWRVWEDGEAPGLTFWPGTPALSGQCKLAHCPSGGTTPQGPMQAFSP